MRKFQIVTVAHPPHPAPAAMEIEAESFHFVDAVTVEFTLADGAAARMRLPDVFHRVRDENGSEFAHGHSSINVDDVVRSDIGDALLVIAGRGTLAQNRHFSSRADTGNAIDGAAGYLSAVLDHHGTL